MSYDVTGTFNAIDNISNIASGIGGNIASMAQNGIDSLASLGEDGFGVADLASAGLTAGIGLLIAAVGEAIGSMVEMDTAMNNISATTGFTGDQLGAMKTETEALFNTGLTGNFQDAANAVAAMNTKIINLDMSGDALKQFGGDALAMSQAWGVSADKIITEVGNMQQKFSDLKGDPQLALDALAKAAQETHLPLQKVMSIVDQYGGVFASAGLSGTDALGLISTASENGVTNMSAVSKSVDTFHQRIINPPKGFEAAMQELGLKNVAKEVQENKIPVTDAMEQVFEAFDKMPDSAQKSQLAIDLFGKSIDKIDPGKLAGFTDGLDGVKGTADQVADAMNDNLGTAIQKAGNNIKTWLGDRAEEAYQNIKSIDWQKIGDSIGAMWDWVKGKTAQVWATIQLAVNSAMNNVAAFLSGAQNTIQGAIGNITNGISVTWSDWFGPSGKIVSFVQGAIPQVATTINGAKDSITGAIQAIVTGATNIWNGIFSTAGSIVGGVTATWTKVKAGIDGAQYTVSTAIQGIIAVINPIWQGLFTAGGTIVSDVTTALQKIIDAANGVVGGVKAAFGAIASAVQEALGPAFAAIQGLVNAAQALINLASGQGASLNAAGAAALGIPTHASGGALNKGFNIVGENGPEVLFSGNSGVSQVFTNNQSRSMAGMANGSAGVTINVSAGTVVGSNGMNEFTRMMYEKFQAEDYRRGKRQ